MLRISNFHKPNVILITALHYTEPLLADDTVRLRPRSATGPIRGVALQPPVDVWEGAVSLSRPLTLRRGSSGAAVPRVPLPVRRHHGRHRRQAALRLSAGHAGAADVPVHVPAERVHLLPDADQLALLESARLARSGRLRGLAAALQVVHHRRYPGSAAAAGAGPGAAAVRPSRRRYSAGLAQR